MMYAHTVSAEEIATVKEAINAIQRSRRADAEKAAQVERSRNKLLARDLEERKAREAVRPCLAERLWEKAVNAYSVTYAIVHTVAELLVQTEED